MKADNDNHAWSLLDIPRYTVRWSDGINTYADHFSTQQAALDFCKGLPAAIILPYSDTFTF